MAQIYTATIPTCTRASTKFNFYARQLYRQVLQSAY